MQYKGYKVDLINDGSFDTVILINDIKFRYSWEYTSRFRRSDGTFKMKDFQLLADEAIEEYEFIIDPAWEHVGYGG